MPSRAFDGNSRWFSTIKWQQNSNTEEFLHGCQRLKRHWSMHTSTSSASTATSLSSALYSSGDVYMMMGFPHGAIIFRWRCIRWQSHIRATSSSSLWKTIMLHICNCIIRIGCCLFLCTLSNEFKLKSGSLDSSMAQSNANYYPQTLRPAESFVIANAKSVNGLKCLTLKLYLHKIPQTS